MRIRIILLFLAISASCLAQQVPVIRITDLEKRVKNDTDTTYIVNFWATWCKPCVAELPDFDSIHTAYLSRPVKVLLVSMDFKEDLESKVIPFLKNKKLKPEVLLLDEVNGNYFIPKVSDNWTGAIPATLIINRHRKFEHFFEKKVTFELLKNELDSVK